MGEAHRHPGEAQRAGPCEGRGRDWRDVSTSRGTPRVAGGPRGWERVMDRFSAGTSKRNQPCCHFDLGLLASRTVRECISVVSCQLVEIWYSSHRAHGQAGTAGRTGRQAVDQVAAQRLCTCGWLEPQPSHSALTDFGLVVQLSCACFLFGKLRTLASPPQAFRGSRIW